MSHDPDPVPLADDELYEVIANRPWLVHQVGRAALQLHRERDELRVRVAELTAERDALLAALKRPNGE